MMSPRIGLLAVGLLSIPAIPCRAEVILDGASQGLYNNALGTTLDGTSLFKLANTTSLPTFNLPEPNLSAAASLLGNWLAAPQSLNANWTGPQGIPSVWALNTENAIVYSFGSSNVRYTGVVLSMMVDNSGFIWLDGIYKNGFRDHLTTVDTVLGDLSPGVHYLQVLREDFGGITGESVFSLTGTAVPVPEPSSAWLMLFAAACCKWISVLRPAWHHKGIARR